MANKLEISFAEQISRDKTPYTYKTMDPTTMKESLQKRYPDITFVLSTAWDASVQHQVRHKAGQTSCEETHIEAHPSLSRERIHKQLFHRRCGLIADPKWGSVDLVFPWAIFEAKKSTVPLDEAEAQLHEGSSIYLGMMDDLTRDPKDPNRYQDTGGKGPQLFAFACSGRLLWIYTAFDWRGDHVGRLCITNLW